MKKWHENSLEIRLAEAIRSQSPLPYSETTTGKFLGELHARNSTSANSAYNYLVLGTVDSRSYRNRDSLDGLLLGFHFSKANAFSGKITATESSLTQLAEEPSSHKG